MKNMKNFLYGTLACVMLLFCSSRAQAGQFEIQRSPDGEAWTMYEELPMGKEAAQSITQIYLVCPYCGHLEQGSEQGSEMRHDCKMMSKIKRSVLYSCVFFGACSIGMMVIIERNCRPY